MAILKSNKGIDQLEKSFAAAAAGGQAKQPEIPDAPEVMEVLRDSLNNITAAHGAAQMAKVVREIVNPEPEPAPDTLDSIIKAKQAGLIGGGEGNGAFSATAQLLSSMLSEQGKAASEARQENKQLTESMIGMMMNNLQGQNQQAMEEIVKRLDSTSNDPFQTAVKQAMAAMLMRSLGDITNPRRAEATPQQGKSMSSLVNELQEMETVYNHLSGFFKRREESLGDMGQSQYRNQWMNPEILRATLEDDRERLKMQMEQRRLEEADRARKETMTKAESIINQIAPILAQALSARQGGAGPQLVRPPMPNEQPQQEVVPQQEILPI